MKPPKSAVRVIFFSGAFSLMASAQGLDGTLSFKVQGWTSQCPALLPEASSETNCALPKATNVNPLEVSVALAPARDAGSAGVTRSRFTLKPEASATASEAKNMEVQLTLDSVFPKATEVWPPYVQIKVEIIAPVRAVCAESVRFRKPFEMPPLICSGFETSQSGAMTQWGITLVNSQMKP